MYRSVTSGSGSESVAAVSTDFHTQTVKVQPVSDGDASQGRRSPALPGNERHGAAASTLLGRTRRLTISPARYDPRPQRTQPEQLAVAVERVLTQVNEVQGPVGRGEQTPVDRPQSVVGQVEAA